MPKANLTSCYANIKFGVLTAVRLRIDRSRQMKKTVNTTVKFIKEIQLCFGNI